MRRFKKFMAAFVFGATIMATPAAAYEYKLHCYSKDLDPRLEFVGTFEMAADGMHGEGQVKVTSAASEGDVFPAVTFYRGMWTTDRLNFYLPGDTGEQIAVVIIEGFFTADPFAGRMRPGVVQGSYANSALTCYNRSCTECMNEPRPSAHCRDVCGCTSPFCGDW